MRLTKLCALVIGGHVACAAILDRTSLSDHDLRQSDLQALHLSSAPKHVGSAAIKSLAVENDVGRQGLTDSTVTVVDHELDDYTSNGHSTPDMYSVASSDTLSKTLQNIDMLEDKIRQVDSSDPRKPIAVTAGSMLPGLDPTVTVGSVKVNLAETAQAVDDIALKLADFTNLQVYSSYSPAITAAIYNHDIDSVPIGGLDIGRTAFPLTFVRGVTHSLLNIINALLDDEQFACLKIATNKDLVLMQAEGQVFLRSMDLCNSDSSPVSDLESLLQLLKHWTGQITFIDSGRMVPISNTLNQFVSSLEKGLLAIRKYESDEVLDYARDLITKLLAHQFLKSSAVSSEETAIGPCIAFAAVGALSEELAEQSQPTTLVANTDSPNGSIAVALQQAKLSLESIAWLKNNPMSAPNAPTRGKAGADANARWNAYNEIQSQIATRRAQKAVRTEQLLKMYHERIIEHAAQLEQTRVIALAESKAKYDEELRIAAAAAEAIIQEEKVRAERQLEEQQTLNDKKRVEEEIRQQEAMTKALAEQYAAHQEKLAEKQTQWENAQVQFTELRKQHASEVEAYQLKVQELETQNLDAAGYSTQVTKKLEENVKQLALFAIMEQQNKSDIESLQTKLASMKSEYDLQVKALEQMLETQKRTLTAEFEEQKKELTAQLQSVKMSNEEILANAQLAAKVAETELENVRKAAEEKTLQDIGIAVKKLTAELELLHSTELTSQAERLEKDYQQRLLNATEQFHLREAELLAEKYQIVEKFETEAKERQAFIENARLQRKAARMAAKEKQRLTAKAKALNTQADQDARTKKAINQNLKETRQQRQWLESQMAYQQTAWQETHDRIEREQREAFQKTYEELRVDMEAQIEEVKKALFETTTKFNDSELQRANVLIESARHEKDANEMRLKLSQLSESIEISETTQTELRAQLETAALENKMLKEENARLQKRIEGFTDEVSQHATKIKDMEESMRLEAEKQKAQILEAFEKEKARLQQEIEQLKGVATHWYQQNRRNWEDRDELKRASDELAAQFTSELQRLVAAGDIVDSSFGDGCMIDGKYYHPQLALLMSMPDPELDGR